MHYTEYTTKIGITSTTPLKLLLPPLLHLNDSNEIATICVQARDPCVDRSDPHKDRRDLCVDYASDDPHTDRNFLQCSTNSTL